MSQRFAFNESQKLSILKELHGVQGVKCSSFSHDAFFLDLESAANRYLLDLPHHNPASKQADIWSRRALLAAEMHEALVTEQQEGGGEGEWLWSAFSRLTAFDESLRDIGLFKRREKTKEKCNKFLEVLNGVQTYAMMRAKSYKDGATGRHPRAVFFDHIFIFWIHVGGSMTVGRHPQTKCPVGPLVRYTQAVSNAVMKQDAPTLETIYKLIRRRRKMFIKTGRCDGNGGSLFAGTYDGFPPPDDETQRLVDEILYGKNLPPR